MKIILTFFLFCASLISAPKVQLGVDQFLKESYLADLNRKRVAIVTNHTGVDSELKLTVDRLIEHEGSYQVVALFSPEHGFAGSSYAGEHVVDGKGKIPCYSLHGDHRRPTDQMLEGIDVIIYDIQEVGARSYTYTTTLYYVMEEAAKRGIQVIVLDRPNPMGGVVVDGPLLEERQKSFVSYLNVPYCHGMTIGELAQFFNAESATHCSLKVISMKGWKREMSFEETGLVWVPTSPQIPEIDTPFYYPATGLLGELELVSIGVGYTLPFKIVGAPWIDADQLAAALNRQKLAGVKFLPFHFKPFFGPYKQQECHGIRLVVTDKRRFRPVTTGYLIMGILKSLYPHEVLMRLTKLSANKKAMFCHVNGTTRIWDLFSSEQYPGWKMASIDSDERKAFCEKRKRYLLY